MSYFPTRTWWFWAYSFIALPSSIAVLIAIILSHCCHEYECAKLLRWNATHRKYEQEIARVRDGIVETQRQWERLFPPHFKTREIQRLNNLVPTLRKKTDELAYELEKAQEGYFSAKTQLELLNKESGEGNSAWVTTQEEEWRKELENMLSSPYIRAVRVVDGSRIQLFTGTFQSSRGGAGPFVIKIDLLSRSFFAEVHHDGSMRDSSGLGGSNRIFCFGNMGSVIYGLLYDYRISEAVTLMIHSFQTNA